MKKLIYLIIGILVLFFLGRIGFSYWFASNFVNKPNPKHQKQVAQRINFGTTAIKNTLQWDTIQSRINTFFKTNPAYQVPDSIPIKERICNGCAELQKVVFLQSKPQEIYKVNFGMGFNYIDKVYKLEGKLYKEFLTTNLDANEKERIKDRLNKEVLDKINWNVEGITRPTKNN